MEFAELDSVALMQDVAAKPDDFSVGAPDGILRAGAIGVIVHTFTYPREAYMVEFVDRLGQTTALPTLLPEQIRLVSKTEPQQ
jgi:Domain of unknown function (DUF4926)